MLTELTWLENKMVGKQLAAIEKLTIISTQGYKEGYTIQAMTVLPGSLVGDTQNDQSKKVLKYIQYIQLPLQKLCFSCGLLKICSRYQSKSFQVCTTEIIQFIYLFI